MTFWSALVLSLVILIAATILAEDGLNININYNFTDLTPSDDLFDDDDDPSDEVENWSELHPDTIDADSIDRKTA